MFSFDCEIVRFVRISECGVFGNPSCVSYLAKHACPDQYFTCRWLNLKYLKIFAIFRRYGWSNTKSSTMHKSLRKRGRGSYFWVLFYRQLISDLDRNLARKIGRFELPKIAKKFDTLLSILYSSSSEIRILKYFAKKSSNWKENVNEFFLPL